MPNHYKDISFEELMDFLENADDKTCEIMHNMIDFVVNAMLNSVVIWSRNTSMEDVSSLTRLQLVSKIGADLDEIVVRFHESIDKTNKHRKNSKNRYSFDATKFARSCKAIKKDEIVEIIAHRGERSHNLETRVSKIASVDEEKLDDETKDLLNQARLATEVVAKA
mgnify:CR=1 FL=1|tara:strand:+ start:2892 stop:3389 length:498 start_codon:yes stop_codon:yes gene_type:complete